MKDDDRTKKQKKCRAFRELKAKQLNFIVHNLLVHGCFFFVAYYLWLNEIMYFCYEQSGQSNFVIYGLESVDS